MTELIKQDEDHLRLLSIFHYIVGGLSALFACFPIIHLVMGLVLIFAPHQMSNGSKESPEAMAVMGWFFVVFAAIMILLGWTFAVCMILAGRFLARRRHYTFCFVMAAVGCIFMPFGTILGVFTIIVLLRPSVKGLFASHWDGK